MSKDARSEPKFVLDGPLRRVEPYYYQYSTFAKERWLGRTLISVFSIDFRDRSAAYYLKAIQSGIIKLNDQIVNPETIIRNSDKITNLTHRHEPPVTSAPIKIVHRDDNIGLLVVEKPGSIPVHVTGRFRFNTLIEIIKHDHGLAQVYTCNRLDRLTSGVMLCATSLDQAKKLGELFNTPGAVSKEYVCRVMGEFSTEDIICEEPLLALDRQLGINIVHPQGKHAKTAFTRLSYHAPSDTSVVRCRPVTGRTHQIRVHLQFLGHPIVNDPFYNNVAAWGRDRARGGLFPAGRRDPNADVEQLLQNVIDHRAAPGADNMDTGTAIDFTPQLRTAVEELRKARDLDDDFARDKDALDAAEARDATKFCDLCGLPLVPDPKPSQLCIWLHASRYCSQAGGWDYSSPALPDWAQEEWHDWEQAMQDVGA